MVNGSGERVGTAVAVASGGASELGARPPIKPVLLENTDVPNPFIVVTDLLIDAGYPLRIVAAEAKNKEKNPGSVRGVEFASVDDLNEVRSLSQSADVQAVYHASVGLGELELEGTTFDARTKEWIEGSYLAKSAERLKGRARSSIFNKAKKLLAGRVPLYMEDRHMKSILEPVVLRFIEART